MNPLAKTGVHDRLTGWSDCNWLWQIGLAGSGYPCYFWGKSFNMIFLFSKSCFRHEHGEVAVGHTVLLESGVEEVLNGLPNEVREGP